MKVGKIVCRGSQLSLAQADIFKRKLITLDSSLTVEIIIKETEGDTNQLQPLTELEGKDFFTKDIQDYLLNGHADFAVHSLKDVSGENFFKDNTYAIIEREDVHDVAIFHEDAVEKLENGETIVIGTSSPRRVTMATEFLFRALPSINGQSIKIEASMIRGNVDTRLRKLDAGVYDGIILACAGLNRLLQAQSSKDEVTSLLKDKKLMVLPLMECPPAPGQGAIVVETSPDNEEAKRILRSLNNVTLAEAVSKERKLAHKYGSGCHQKFGVVHIATENASFTYAAGRDRSDKPFTDSRPEGNLKKSEVISEEIIKELLNKQSIHLLASLEDIAKGHWQNKKIWVSKTDLWFDLAQQGIWVQGSFENLGWKFNEATVNGPLVSLTK